MTQAATEALRAEHVLEYPYERSTGPVIGRFLAGLRDRRILGIQAADGRVLVPPQEYDPVTSEELDPGTMTAVGPGGVVTTWSWQPRPRDGQPLDEPFAWALIRLDGADTPMLHAVDVGRPGGIRTGMRVTPRWAEETQGHIHDIVCFVPEEDDR